MRLASLKASAAQKLLLCALTIVSASAASPAAHALVVENMTGTTSAPADDPGWNYVTTGGRNLVYLRDGWILSAFHVGVPTPTEALSINGSSFNVISNQAYIVKNQSGQELTSDTDLRMFRINGDPGLAPINIASQQPFASTPIAQREVVIIGNGPSRMASESQWNVQIVPNSPVPPNPPPPNDIWTEVASGTYKGYKSLQPSDNVKRWGKNQIADEDPLFGGSDPDLRGDLKLTLGVGVRDVMSMVTQFDNPLLPNGSPNPVALTNEAQVVSGDSGSSVFYKRNGQWELIGIVNAQYSTIENQSTANAVYGNYTTFADLTYYHDDIFNIMNANANYSVLGDINLDGVVSGGTSGGVPTGDIAAFVSGWGYNNGTGAGTITSWKNGDLNHDGKTNSADFLLLRTALNPSGAGGLTLESLLGGVGVPEPTSLFLALAGAGVFAYSRHRRR